MSSVDQSSQRLLWRRRRRAERPPGRSRSRIRLFAAFAGAILVAGVAYSATNWAVGLSGGSSAEGQGASVSNISISAVASPAAANLLYPGGRGDIVVSISNPNPFPVPITPRGLPAH